ncbi:NAC domain protein [Striga asiatica]|uniref:NAC domain protein n=1 Tax=Striga asiatica TaxID=4170 RepID=A0A5A7QM37_STRAF|nr:NAC domain protein [Striga asiatica]
MEKNNNSNEQNQAKDDGASNMRQGTHELASTSTQRSRFPPGYRFMPTDHELIVDYLMKKVNNDPIPVDEMSEVELYLWSPESLAEIYPQLGDKEWYFFTPRDRKYPNGSRPSRSVKEGGYWKATGADRPIFSGSGEIIGRKKALVFYMGNPKPGEGKKTNWIMHEYKLNTPSKSPNCNDDWVLCRMYKKPERSNKKQRDVDDSVPDDEESSMLESPLLGDSSELEDDNKGNIVIMEDDNKGIVVMEQMAEQSPMITSNDNGIRDVNVYHQNQLLSDNSYQLSTNSYSMNFPYVADDMTTTYIGLLSP